MSLSIRVNGKPFTHFQNATVMRSIESLCGRFTLTSSADDNELFPVLAGDAVEILADDVTILTGFVDKSGGSYDDKSHQITVNGRDRLSDLVDSTVARAVEFSPNIGLESIVKHVLRDLGIDVEVINNAGKIENFTETEIQSEGIGQNAFQFLESLARKRQVLLTSDFKSNIVLIRGNTGKIKTPLKHIKGGQRTGQRGRLTTSGDDNNIKSAQWDYDLSNRFNKYTVQAQLVTTFLGAGTTPEDAVTQSGSATDDQIRKTRVLEINSEENADASTAGLRAIWEANIRRARSFSYFCTVQGHSVDGAPWDFNKLVHVSDVFADLSSEFLIKQVDFSYNKTKGSSSKIGITYKDAFTLQAEQDARESSQGDQGDSFFV